MMNLFQSGKIFTPHRLSLLLCGIILLFNDPAGPLRAEQSTPPQAPIWEIQGPTSKIILAGSIHTLREKDLPIPQGFHDAYDQADRLVFEIDLKEHSDPEIQTQLRSQSFLPKNDALSAHLDAKLLDDLKSYSKPLGLKPAYLERFRPGTLLFTLAFLDARRHGADPKLGIEHQLFQRCQADGKLSSGLETTLIQHQLFQKIEIAAVSRMLRELIDEQDDAEAALDELITAWKSGDPQQIEAIIATEIGKEESVKQILLDDRNLSWIPEIEQAITGDETVLFVVGAAHLVGEGSVIDLLEKRGHTITRFTPTVSVR